MKKLLFFLLTISLISCSGSSLTGGPDLCIVKIKYHTSGNCDDTPKIVDFYNPYELVSKIESKLSVNEIGECVLMNLYTTSFYLPQDANLSSVYLVNDTDKSWLVSNGCNY